MRRPPFREASTQLRNRRRPTLPGRIRPSTIGATGLNFCVRNGNRCDPSAIATEKVTPNPNGIATGLFRSNPVRVVNDLCLLMLFNCQSDRPMVDGELFRIVHLLIPKDSIASTNTQMILGISLSTEVDTINSLRVTKPSSD